jgi:dGTPase
LRRAPGEAAWCRHPLAFLVEAADDICYRIVDVEDAFRAGQLEFAEIEPLLLAIVTDESARRRVRSIATDERRVEYLRAQAISVLVDEVSDAFAQQGERMLSGEFDSDLVSVIPHAEPLEALRELAMRRVYGSAPAREAGAPGHEVLGELLSAFLGAVASAAERPSSLSARASGILAMVPDQFLGPGRAPESNLYQRVLGITDFVSGMTDTFAATTRERFGAD